MVVRVPNRRCGCFIETIANAWINPVQATGGGGLKACALFALSDTRGTWLPQLKRSAIPIAQGVLMPGDCPGLILYLLTQHSVKFLFCNPCIIMGSIAIDITAEGGSQTTFLKNAKYCSSLRESMM
jgi:hypothetical protein